MFACLASVDGFLFVLEMAYSQAPLVGTNIQGLTRLGPLIFRPVLACGPPKFIRPGLFWPGPPL